MIIGKVLGKVDFLFLVGWFVNWHSSSGEQFPIRYWSGRCTYIIILQLHFPKKWPQVPWEMYTRMFIIALFVILKNWKQSEFPFQRINQEVVLFTMQQNIVTKMKKERAACNNMANLF